MGKPALRIGDLKAHGGTKLKDPPVALRGPPPIP